jgi:hypothetical protein
MNILYYIVPNILEYFGEINFHDAKIYSRIFCTVAWRAHRS